MNRTIKIIIVIIFSIAIIILKTVKSYQLTQKRDELEKLETEFENLKTQNIEFNRKKYFYQYLDIQYHLNTGINYPCVDCCTFKHHDGEIRE